MKKRWWLVLSVILILVALIGWWMMPHSALKKEAGKLSPQVDVMAIAISDIDDDRIKLNAKIILSNSLPVEINSKRIDYEIFIDSVKVIQSSYTKPFRLGVSSNQTIDLPMEILAGPMNRVLKTFEDKNRDSANYVMKVGFQVDVPIAGERNFKVEIERRLPAIRIPTGKLQAVDVDKLGFKESSLSMILLIDNKNVFPLKLKDGKYKMAIDDDLEMDGVLEKDIDIPSKSKTPISMNLTIKTPKLGKLVWKGLFERRNTHFVLVFRGKIDTENSALHNSNLTMKMTGTLDELKKSKDRK